MTQFPLLTPAPGTQLLPSPSSFRRLLAPQPLTALTALGEKGRFQPLEGPRARAGSRKGGAVGQLCPRPGTHTGGFTWRAGELGHRGTSPSASLLLEECGGVLSAAWRGVLPAPASRRDLAPGDAEQGCCPPLTGRSQNQSVARSERKERKRPSEHAGGGCRCSTKPRRSAHRCARLAGSLPSDSLPSAPTAGGRS